MPPSHGISRQRITAGGCFCIFASWFRKRWKITFLVGEKYFSSWKNEKEHLEKVSEKKEKDSDKKEKVSDKKEKISDKKEKVSDASSYNLDSMSRYESFFSFFIRGREVKRGQEKRMNPNMKAFIKYLIVAVCSAIVTYLTSSCTAGLVIGKNQRQQQENNISTRADSTHFVPTITIR